MRHPLAVEGEVTEGLLTKSTTGEGISGEIHYTETEGFLAKSTTGPSSLIAVATRYEAAPPILM